MTLLGQPLGVVRMGQHRRGQVRAAHRLARLPCAPRSAPGRPRSRAPAARPPSRRRGARGRRARRAGARGAARCGGRSRSRARAGPRSSPSTAEISVAGVMRTPWSAPAASASSTPSTVSWSERASSSTPASAAFATTSATGSSPSEWSECDWRSKAGSVTGAEDIRVGARSDLLRPRGSCSPRSSSTVPMIGADQAAEVEHLAVADAEQLGEEEEADERPREAEQDRDEEAARIRAGDQCLRDVAGHEAEDDCSDHGLTVPGPVRVRRLTPRAGRAASCSR